MRVRRRSATGRRWGVPALAAAALVLGLAPAVGPASAATFAGGARTLSVTSSSVTVAASTSWGDGRFRILASTRRADLRVGRLAKATVSTRTTQSVATLSGLRYSTAPYFYRVQAVRGGSVSYSAVRKVYLRPPTPSLRLVSGGTRALALMWSGVSASRYVVIRAEDPSMTQGRRVIALDPRVREYTPLDLVPGQQYWFQVQAFNGPTASLPSPVTTAVQTAAGVTVRAMTYNILSTLHDGSVSSGNRIAAWSERRLGVAALIRQSDPDLIALQEASGWVKAKRGPRQVDDLRAMLGSSTYSLARTEVPPSEPNYLRTGRYLLYRSSMFRTVGEGGHWTIGAMRYAAYQVLQHRDTGATFLAVAVHLEPGRSRATDLMRQAQTRVLLAKVAAYLDGRALPVVYLGDFNSHEKSPNVFDGPATVLRPAHLSDSDEVAAVTVNRSLNSSNLYLRRAPRTYRQVDHIWVTPGVGVRRYEVVANLRSGLFVGTIPSDHNPVTSDLVLPYQAG
jgi:endonuclease/exonuclease/phosphatase family metal-dependent hydrolase